MNFKLYSVFGLFFLLISCNSSISKEDTLSYNDDGKDVIVTLENETLWKANEYTSIGMKNMIKLMQDLAINKANSKDFDLLTENLKNEFTLIFQKCTMKGEAHNQLHNFLIPINNEFETLGSGDLETAKVSYDRLLKHLKTYSLYFE
jgi:hypothetical protein